MKFKVSVSDLQYAMRLVRGIAPNANAAVSPEAAGVLIVAEEGRAEFRALNSVMQAKATIKIECLEPGTAAVSVEFLYNAVSKFQAKGDNGCGTSDITLSTDPAKNKFVVAARTSYASGATIPHRRVFPLLNSALFPEFPKVTGSHNFSLPASTLMDGIDGVLYAVASDRTLPALSGVLFCLQDKKLVLAGADGVCIAEYSASVPYSGEELNIIVAGSFAAKVAKSFFDDDLLNIVVNSRQIFVSTPNFTLSSSLINDNYPDYKGVVPTPEVYITIDKEILRDNLLNLGYEAAKDKDDNRVALRFNQSKLTLACGDSENEGIETDFTGDAKFDCKLNLLVRSIAQLQGDTVRVGFIADRKPVQFFPSSGLKEGLRTVLVPLAPE